MSLFRRALVALAAVVPLWAWVFRGTRWNFWTRMTLATGALSVYALRSRPELKQELPRPRDLPRGIASAAGLYALFQVGDVLARRIMPSGQEDIAEIYRLRHLAPRAVIAATLATIVGPGEELFWRGLIQHAFMQRFGRTRGTAAAVAAYGGVHLASGNLTLTGAATTAGAYWGSEYALRPRLGPLLVSHILWDIWIFLLAPTPGGRIRR